MLNRKVILALAAQTCLLAGAAFGQATPPIPISFTRSFTFLPVGLALTETAQVTVVNTAGVVSVATLAVPAAPSCTGSISFLNASGAVIGTPGTFTVGSGQIAVVSLPYGSAGATGGARVQIRAEVQSTGTTPPTAASNAPCSLQFSFQTFDTGTGVTHVYLSGGGLAQVVPFGRN